MEDDIKKFYLAFKESIAGLPKERQAYLMMMFKANPMLFVEEAQKEAARTSLKSFIPYSWPVLEPGTTYKPGWHIDAISDHLEAVTHGHIKRLLINIPPRHMKSLLCSAIWPTWSWLKEPSKRFLTASYDLSLAIRDCRKSRDIVRSELYQDLIPVDRHGDKVWEMSSDQNLKGSYANTLRGHRQAISVGSGVTGKGGDIIIVDDAHNVQSVSDATLEAVRIWWKEALQSRLNNPATGAIVVIMQRISERDLSGVILEGDDEYVHLCLPHRFEGKCRIKNSPLPWKDKRTDHGEPLWKEHMPEEALQALEAPMTEYAIAGQYYQRPAPRGGGMFKSDNWMLIDSIDESKIVRSVRFWDRAGTEGAGDYTCGALVHIMKNGTFVVADIIRGQWSYAKREAVMKSVCEADKERYGASYSIYMEQEGGSAGKDMNVIAKNNLIKEDDGTFGPLLGTKIESVRPTGEKEVRAMPLAAAAENHAVFVLRRPWFDEWNREMSTFPAGAHDDQVDATAGAFNCLGTLKRKKAGGGWGMLPKIA